MIKKIKNYFNKGIFRNYFIGNLIETKEDAEAFKVFYQDKVGVIMVANLLGLKMEVKENEIEFYGKNGEKESLSFSYAGNFLKNPMDIEFDVDRLFAVVQLLKKEAETIYPKENFENFAHLQFFLINNIIKNAGSGEYEKRHIQGLKEEMFKYAQNEIFIARPNTSNYDEDVVLASSYHASRWLEARVGNGALGYVSPKEISDVYDKILSMQFQLQIDARENERTIAEKYQNQENNPPRYWGYIKQMGALKEHPEMW